MGLPILYSFRRCPYAMRARWALLSCNIQVVLREVDLKAKPLALLEASSKATVPVLIASNGDVIDESLNIMKWSLENSNTKPISFTGDFDMIKMNDEKFKYHLDRYKYPNRFLLHEGEKHRKFAREILLEWNSRIVDNANSYCFVNDKESLADWAIWPFVRQYRNVDPLSFDHENELSSLRAWLRSYLDNSKFKTLMVKSKPWIPGEKKKYFPPRLDS